MHVEMTRVKILDGGDGDCDRTDRLVVEAGGVKITGLEIYILSLVGFSCTQDSDGDYDHAEVVKRIGIFCDVGDTEALDQKYRDVYQSVLEQSEDMEDPDPNDCTEEYSSPHDEISGNWVAELFWNTWSENFYDYESRLEEAKLQ